MLMPFTAAWPDVTNVCILLVGFCAMACNVMNNIKIASRARKLMVIVIYLID
jgi:hypothetical protein